MNPSLNQSLGNAVSRYVQQLGYELVQTSGWPEFHFGSSLLALEYARTLTKESLENEIRSCERELKSSPGSYSKILPRLEVLKGFRKAPAVYVLKYCEVPDNESRVIGMTFYVDPQSGNITHDMTGTF